jgi:Arc/MetJ-type ribon-helix-helix transcriptional regulator
MARHLAPSNLPENVVRYAQDQVDAGRFATIEDVLSAGIEALQERDQADQEWFAYARTEVEVGFAALDGGEGILLATCAKRWGGHLAEGAGSTSSQERCRLVIPDGSRS